MLCGASEHYSLMNYSEIVALGLSYSDRDDIETANRVDDFLRVVESRVNKKLKTQKMGSRTALPIVLNQTEYDLPADFSGLREIKVVDGDRQRTMQLVTPEFMASVKDEPGASFAVTDPSFATSYYAIIADKLNIYPPQNPSGTLDLVYYKRVPALTSAAPNNWLSDDNPECYTFGLVVEISAFAKDAEATGIWDGRFKESMQDIHMDDQVSRWGGTPMALRIV